LFVAGPGREAQAERDRKAAVNFLRLFWRVARQVFHETTGTLFLLFAFVDASASWREWRHGNALWAAGLAAGLSLAMVVFGMRSFRDARRLG